MIEKLTNKITPQQFIVIGFLGVLAIGCILLMLPIASNSGEITNFWDALFTATSALCVTGQITLNTAEHWSYFGKTVILILIEIGGLGIMTLVIYTFFLLGKKVNLRQQKIIQESLNLEGLSETKLLIRYIIKFSLVVQILGAIILSFDFIPRLGSIKGIYFSIFHSISAFCNAGFDLFGSSLLKFQENPLVLLTIMCLIIIGGTGFIVWRDLLTYKNNKRLLLHTRLVIKSTLIILVASIVLIWFSEYRNGTFLHLNPIDKLTNVAFLAVTPRTAGYSNIDYNILSSSTIFITYILMFIGGSSGSTAGGIKTTTVAVLILFIKSSFKRESTHYLKRSINHTRVKKSILILMIGLIAIISATIALLLTQSLPPQFGIEAVLLEVISCFGTVGLSMGVTPYLNWFGKLVLMILMFAGRVGSITFLLSFGAHDRDSHIKYPEGSVLIG